MDMGTTLQFNIEPTWKLAAYKFVGVGLLLLSFAVTGWLLGVAAVALDSVLDSLSAVIDTSNDIFHPGHSPFAG